LNPELRRNLWLELSAHRLVAMPAILALVFVLFYVPGRGADGAGRLLGVAAGAFVVLVHFWGSKQAAESITDEMRDRTWDWQRLSSLGPWPMTWGKLVGATAFQWYGGAVCLATLMAVGFATGARDPGWSALGLAASGLLVHAFMFAASLQAARKRPKLGNRVGAILFLPVFVVLALTGAFPSERSGALWFGVERSPIAFVALSACAFAAWAVLGAYREMSRELRVLLLPWAYPAFALFVAAYAMGFIPGMSPWNAFAVAGLASSAALFYYALFAEHTTAMSLRRLAICVARADWRRAADALPMWAPMVLVVSVFCIAAMRAPIPPTGPESSALGAVAIAGALLVLRDAGILVFFALSPSARRTEAATMLYLALLYWILPGVLTVAGLGRAAGTFFPILFGGAGAVAGAAVHVAIAWGLAAWRWRRMQERFARG